MGQYIKERTKKFGCMRSQNKECDNKCIDCTTQITHSVGIQPPSTKRSFGETCGCKPNYYAKDFNKKNLKVGIIFSCHPCPPGQTSPKGSIGKDSCIGQTYDEKFSSQSQLIGQITKSLSASKNAENNVNAGQITKLQRMWATNEVRKKYDEMRIQNATAYQKHGENACKHEQHEQKDKTKRRMHIFAAVQLNEEVTENTCLSTNRDELIKSFCNFRKDFDETLANQNIKKKGTDLWPNICCTSNGEKCKIPEGINADEMVPFALAQGGKVTKQSLYGEILDVLRAKGHQHHPNGGYLLQGMLQALDEVKDMNGAEELKTEIINVFKRIHLCGPKTFTSPTGNTVKMCQLFHPYGQLFRSFHDKFQGILIASNANKVLVPQTSVSTLFLQKMDKLSKNKHAVKKQNQGPRRKEHNICRLPLADETEVKQKKKIFCSMYQPFDTTDEKRITNYGIFYVGKDVGRDQAFVEDLSKQARFVADDKCHRTSPMFTGDDFSLQSIDGVESKKEWVLVAKLDSSSKSYLRTDAGNCDSTEWLPHVTLKFGIYVDKNNCCAKTKNIASCHQCSSKNAPKILDHHWTKEKLFYEMTVTGNAFELKLDGNPILAGTKYTLLEKPNSLKPKNGEIGAKLMIAVQKAVADKKDNTNNEKRRRRRRLVGFSDDWDEFTTYVQTAQGTCNSQILQDVSVSNDGSFSFKCSQAAALCNCIQHVGGSGEEQHFVAGNIGLNVFRQDGLVGYEITEDGEAFSYGDVNEGRMDRRRRRRLLQSDGAGGS